MIPCPKTIASARQRRVHGLTGPLEAPAKDPAHLIFQTYKSKGALPSSRAHSCASPPTHHASPHNSYFTLITKDNDNHDKPRNPDHRLRRRHFGIIESPLPPESEPSSSPNLRSSSPILHAALTSLMPLAMLTSFASSDREIESLKGIKPLRTRFLHGHTTERAAARGHRFYAVLFGDLFEKALGVADMAVGAGDRDFPFQGGDGAMGRSPWDVALDKGLTKEFIYYAGLVAKADSLVGGWDGLFGRAVGRKALVTGVLARVLEIEVFDDLLFGGTEEQKTMLEMQDRANRHLESYLRTSLRHTQIATWMADAPLTPQFWRAVDQLATRITQFLLPLIRTTDHYFPPNRDHHPLRIIHQHIHNTVQLAGYLSLAMRCSRSIFRFDSPLPGEPWSLNYEHFDDTLWAASRAAAARADSRLATIGAGLRPRLAKVLVVLWPLQTHYTPSAPPDADFDRLVPKHWPAAAKADGIDSEGGETISIVMPAQVAYYAGQSELVEQVWLGRSDLPRFLGRVRGWGWWMRRIIWWVVWEFMVGVLLALTAWEIEDWRTVWELLWKNASSAS